MRATYSRVGAALGIVGAIGLVILALTRPQASRGFLLLLAIVVFFASVRWLGRALGWDTTTASGALIALLMWMLALFFTLFAIREITLGSQGSMGLVLALLVAALTLSVPAAIVTRGVAASLRSPEST